MPALISSFLFKRSADTPVWLIAAWIAFIVGLIGWQLWRASVRKQRLEEAAMQIGFMPAQDVPLVCEMPIFQHRNELSNMFTGAWQGLDACVFDLQIGQGKGAYRQTVAGFRRDRVNMPPFQVAPKSWTDAIASKFGGEIVRIDDPDFAKVFTVRSQTPMEAAQFFTPEVRSYLVSSAASNFVIEGSVDSIIVYRRRKMVAPDRFTDFLNDSGNVAIGLIAMLRTAVF